MQSPVLGISATRLKRLRYGAFCIAFLEMTDAGMAQALESFAVVVENDMAAISAFTLILGFGQACGISNKAVGTGGFNGQVAYSLRNGHVCSRKVCPQRKLKINSRSCSNQEHASTELRNAKVRCIKNVQPDIVASAVALKGTHNLIN